MSKMSIFGKLRVCNHLLDVVDSGHATRREIQSARDSLARIEAALVEYCADMIPQRGDEG